MGTYIEMTKFERLTAIRELSKKNSKWIHRDIFRLLGKDKLWQFAYKNLKENIDKRSLFRAMRVASGVYQENTLDGMSLNRLKALRLKVMSESYIFKPIRLIKIPRPDGRKRPSSGKYNGFPSRCRSILNNSNDKIVQEVMRLIFEAIYEPLFSEVSFGFRAGSPRGYQSHCHNALDHVEKRFRWVDWIIKGDIEVQQAYPTISHEVLIHIIERRINDPRFIRLVRKLLKSGILEEKRVLWSDIGIPQGSIVSPILINIYYHELDEFIQTLVVKYQLSVKKRNTLRSKEYKSIGYRIYKVRTKTKGHDPHSIERKKLEKKMRRLQVKRLSIPSLRNRTIVPSIEYVRYADNWMIGVAGDKSLALKIKKEVRDFILTTLKQTIYPVETVITDLRKGNTHFLGYDIFFPRNRSISYLKGTGVPSLRRSNLQLRFDVPVHKLTKRYIELGYLKKDAKGVRTTSKALLACLEDHVIVSHYRSIWLGLSQYYTGCTNLERLQYFHHLLHMSCAMTLGHRHRMSCSRIFAKHKKKLTVKVNDDKSVEFPYRTHWRRSDRVWKTGRVIQFSS